MWFMLFIATYIWAAIPTFIGLHRSGQMTMPMAAMSALAWPYTAYLAIKEGR